MRTMIRFALGAAAAIGIAGAAQAQISASGFSDGSFETQAATVGTGNYCYFGMATAGGPACGAGSWMGNAGSGFIGVNSTAWPGVQGDGSYHSFIQGEGVLTQTFIALQSGMARISWLDAGRSANGFNGDHAYNLLLDGVSLFTGTTNGQTAAGAAFSRQLVTGVNIVAGQTYTLSFAGMNSGSDTTSFIDNVSVAVPEAGTWAMMIIGFGAVGGAMRRRRAVRPTLATA